MSPILDLEWKDLNHRNWIKVDITIFQYIHGKLNCTGSQTLGFFIFVTSEGLYYSLHIFMLLQC